MNTPHSITHQCRFYNTQFPIWNNFLNVKIKAKLFFPFECADNVAALGNKRQTIAFQVVVLTSMINGPWHHASCLRDTWWNARSFLIAFSVFFEFKLVHVKTASLHSNYLGNITYEISLYNWCLLWDRSLIENWARCIGSKCGWSKQRTFRQKMPVPGNLSK